MKSTLSQKMYVKLHKHNLTAFKIFVYFSLFVMFPYAMYYVTMSADHIDVLSDAEQHSTSTQKVLLKILDTIETDGDLLSDGEVIDMIHCLLNSISLQQLKAECDS